MATGSFGAFRFPVLVALFVFAGSGSLYADSVLSSFYKNVHADASEPILKGIAEFENRASAPALGWTCIKTLEPIAAQNNDAFLHLLIGFAASERNLYKLAQSHLEQAVANLNRDYSVTPELHFAVRYWLGRAYLGQGLDDKAETILREAVDVIAKQPGLYQQSILWPNKSISDSFVKSMVARLLFDYQREETALSYYLQIDSMRTSGSDYHHAVYYTGCYPADLARCYAALGKHKEAAQWFETALSRSKWNWCEQVILHIDAGWQALAAEDFDAALKHAESALSLQKYCRSALVISARAKIGKKDFDSSAKDAWTAWHLDNDHPDVTETFRLLKEKGGRDFAEWQSATKPEKPEDRWNNFPIFVWLDKEGPEKNEKFYELLKSIGINGCAITGRSDSDFLTKCGMLFYVENAVRGEYLRMNRDSYKEQMERYAKDAYDTTWMTRPKSFFDPSDKEVALRDMYGIVVQHGPNKPMAYSLGDEISYGCLVNPMDLDIDARAMKAYRKWLETRYSTIDKLNGVWETAYKNFGEVELWDVEKTRLRALKAGPDKYNFAPWNDHLEFNDELFARELKSLVDCFHDLDPWTPVGIGGAQVDTAFGGYDWGALSRALDWAEPYEAVDIKNIITDLRRARPFRFISAMGPLAGTRENTTRQRLYQRLPWGDDSVLIWQASDLFPRGKDTLDESAVKNAPELKQLRSFRSQFPHLSVKGDDSVAIAYSHTSYRLNWFAEACTDKYWYRRLGSYSRHHSFATRQTTTIARTLRWSGHFPRYIRQQDLYLDAGRYNVVVYPYLLSVSDELVQSARLFLETGGTIITVGWCGKFDNDGRMRPPSLPEELVGEDMRPLVKTIVSNAMKSVSERKAAYSPLPSVHKNINLTVTNTDCALVVPIGKGRLIVLSNIEQEMDKRPDGSCGPAQPELARIIEDTLTASGFMPSLRIAKLQGNDQKPMAEPYLWQATDGTRWLSLGALNTDWDADVPLLKGEVTATGSFVRHLEGVMPNTEGRVVLTVPGLYRLKGD